MRKLSLQKKKNLGFIAIAFPVGIYLLYLIAVNLFLNIESAHNRINRQPEQRRITWDSGHSFFPGTVSLSGFRMEFNRKRNDWTLNIESVRGRISLLPLIRRTFRVSNLVVDGLDFEYHRLKTPHNPIKNRRKKEPWTLHFQDFQVSLVRKIELQGYLLEGTGQAEGTLHMITRGEMQLFPSKLKMQDISLSKEEQQLASGLKLELGIETDVFTPSVDKGRKSLKYFIANLNFEGELSEDFIPKSIFEKLSWLMIEDQGLFHGQIGFERGAFLEGSRFGIMNTKLSASYQDLSINGSGHLDLVLKESSTQWDNIQRVDLETRFTDFKVLKSGLPTPLLTGKRFIIVAETKAFDLEKRMTSIDIRLEMDKADIPKIKHMNSFLQTYDFFAFESGSAQASGQFQFLGDQNEGGGWLAINSDQVSIALKDKPFSGRFEFRTHFSEFRPGTPKIVFTGSSIKLENPEKAWFSNFILTEGFLTWPKSSKILPGKKVLKNAEGDFKITGELSDIGFINPFLQGLHQEQHGFHLQGSAKLQGDLILSKGDLEAGTSFNFDVPDIKATFIGYQAKGRASVFGAIKKTKGRPGRKKAHVDLVIHDYTVSRKGLKDEHSDGKLLTASMRLPDFSLARKKHDIEIKINLPENRIKEMNSYNAFFGENTSFLIRSGTATSHGNLSFSSKTEELTGTFELYSSDLEASFESLPITANFHFKGLIKSQNIKNMVFNLEGSTIHLDHVTTGNETPVENWELAMEFGKTQLTWQQPMLAKGFVNLEMTDTAPIMSVFAEKKRLLKYVNKVLTIKNIRGECDFDLNHEFFDIPDLRIRGEELFVLGKFRMNRTSKRGACFIQFKRLPFTLSLEDDKKRIHLIHPQGKYQEFPVFQASGSTEKAK